MRSHGVPNFPDPNSQGDFPPSHLQPGVSKQTAIAAQHACQHLLPNGGSTGTLQQDQLKLAFALKVARCLRAHGFPTLPDPTVSSRAGNDLAGAGIDPNSPRFQAAQTTCEKQAKQALALP